MYICYDNEKEIIHDLHLAMGSGQCVIAGSRLAERPEHADMACACLLVLVMSG